MRAHIRTLALLIGTAAMPCALAATENGGNAPFDFSYRVAGSPGLRPTLVFHDGRDTYLELNRDVKVTTSDGAAHFRQGPYYVIRGISAEIVLSAQGEKVTVSYEPAVRAQAPVVPVLQAAVAAPAIAVHTPVAAASPDAQPARPPASPVVTAAPAAATPAAAIPVALAVAAPSAVATQPSTPVVSDQGAAVPACTPKTIENESTLLVSFAASSERLSADSVKQLEREAQRRDVQLSSVRVRVANSQSELSIAKRRQAHLSDVLSQAGIPRSIVRFESGQTFRDMTEVVFIHGANKPCEKRPPVVALRDGFLTVISHDADAATLMTKVAEAMTVPLRIEGKARELPVAVMVAADTPSGALARIGAALGKGADIVLRDKELVLRFN